ncbi:MAG: CarD family transcriptional regulator [Synergistaceae bacterium]|jgi:CarD family transcriptional regulator|nr:CarD family transcriptional regulator [Synergistaceae bacterium]
MYKENDTVMYSAHGICKIAEIVEKDMGSSSMEYYVLKPIKNDGATIFVPVENKDLTAKMRRVMTKEEIWALLDEMPDKDTIWMDDEFVRRVHYRDIISSGDRGELMSLVKTLYLHKQSQKAMGKRMKSADEDILKDAEKMIHDEFSYVLDIRRDEVLPIILERVNKSAQQAGA